MNPLHEPPPPFELTDHERASALWLRLRLHLDAELAAARAENDAMGKGPEHTAFLRGRIAQLKALLALQHDAPRIT